MLVTIVGPTGVGKSEASLDLAERFIAAGHAAEIVNADAMQLYRGMDIGTAKIPVDERRGIPHHLIDVLDVTDEATVAWYQSAAREIIEDIAARGALPILVGGSGLYVSSVIFDFRFPGHDDALRARLEEEMGTNGPAHMYSRLATLAPEVADRIDQQNERRIIRALEVIELTGSAASLGTLPEDSLFWRPTAVFGLSLDRAELVSRLDRRVENMWDRGLIEEVRSLIPRGLSSGVTARRAIGYAQALAEISGEMTSTQAREETQSLTRRYARRQVSWFTRYRHAQWLPAGETSNIDVMIERIRRGT